MDGPEIDYPEQAREILDDREVHHIRRRVLNGANRYPFGPRIGRALLEKELAVGPIGVSLHYHRAVEQMRQEERRNVGIILEEIALGNAVFRPKDLLQIGKCYAPAVYVDFGGRFIRRDFDTPAVLFPEPPGRRRARETPPLL